MASSERYRIWLTDGKYETAVALNRDEAVGLVIGRGIPRRKLKAVGKATQRGRLFKIEKY